MTREAHTQKAFTLVEVLTVVAIVAVLMGLLIPGLAKVRTVLRQTQCANNLRQLYAAFEVYAQDNNNVWPPIFDSPSSTTRGTNDWSDILFLQMYGKAYTSTLLPKSAFACPAAMANGERGISYGINLDLSLITADGLQKSPIPRLRINNPTTVCLLIENANEVAGPSARFQETVWPTRNRHGLNISVLYCDGHVATLPIGQVPSTSATVDGKVFWRAQ